jgi:hypothetical protein
MVCCQILETVQTNKQTNKVRNSTPVLQGYY